MQNNGKFKSKSLHIFALLFILVFASSVLTYIIPAGSFLRTKDIVSGQNIVIPGSYQQISRSPVPPWTIPAIFFETLTSSGVARLIFFIIFIGGSFEIIMQSGCISALCRRSIEIFKNRGLLIIPVFIALFSVFGFTMGLTTASIVFVPIGITIARALGFDALTGMAMVMLGTNAGFAAGIFNPFSVGIAQSIAELPMFSGAWLRWILLVVLLFFTSYYIMRYAKKEGSIGGIKQADDELWAEAQNAAAPARLTKRQQFVMVVFALTLVIITVGVSYLHWDISEIAISFMIMGFVSGLVSGFGVNKTCEFFLSGCKKMMKGALIIGIAATMRTVLARGNIMDTIANSLIGTVYKFPAWAQLLGMFYANAAIDPIITSGSAHAAVVMPVMVPMADALTLSRQSAVFAFQLGDGLVNLISPISTTLTSCLAVSNVSFGKWTRFFIPLVSIYMLIGTAFIIIAGLTGY